MDGGSRDDFAGVILEQHQTYPRPCGLHLLGTPAVVDYIGDTFGLRHGLGIGRPNGIFREVKRQKENLV